MLELDRLTPPVAVDVPKLARAIRFALVCFILGLSYLNIRSSLTIRAFGEVFADMLAGKPLPMFTVWVLWAGPFFVAVSFLIPLAVIGTLFLRQLAFSFYLIGILSLVIVAQLVILSHGLLGPAHQIISGMTSPP